MSSWAFELRWIFWGVGGVSIFLLFLNGGRAQGFCGLPRRADRQADAARIQGQIEKTAELHFSKILITLCGLFFLFSVCAKFSQLQTFQLNGQDFWLFADLLEQAKKGVFFLTRFAPQSLGYVQHGSVHPMLTWAALTPLAWIFGSVPVALVFNPAVLAAAGGMLALLTRRKWGALTALIFGLAFMASTQVGKIMVYDVHPEAAYPLLVFCWLGAMGLSGSQKVRWIGVVVSTALCVGLKEDSVLVLGPWLLWALISLKGTQRKAAALSTVVAIGVAVLQMLAVKNWVSGGWGPAVWQGSSVVTQAGVGLFQGAHWTSLSDILGITEKLIQSGGGGIGLLHNLGNFLISRPWLSLLVFAPWVVIDGKFWIAIFPLAAVYSLLGMPRVLWLYYSAPFLGTFWFAAMTSRWMRKSFAPWVLVTACLLGSSSPSIYWPSAEVREIQRETQALLPCIGQQGLVSSHLLGMVPPEKIWTERLPRSSDDWAHLDYVLFSPGVGRYEMSVEVAQKLFEDLGTNPAWKQIDSECHPLLSGNVRARVVLFRRNVL